MTFFLQDAQRDIPANSVRRLTSTGLGSGIAAASKAAAIENDANFKASTTKNNVATERLDDFIEAIGPEAAWGELQSAGIAPATPYDPNRGFARLPVTWKEHLTKYARTKAEEDGYDGPDLSDEGIEGETNERLQKEYEAARAVVEMMPRGQGLAEFAGGMIGPTADVKNIPFMLFGGGAGSFMRVMGQNAAINMAAEATFLPAQFDMAERLEIPEPNIGGQLMMAGIAGGVFGGAEEAARRGIRYFRTRNLVSDSLTGFEAAQWDARVAEAEQALSEGADLPDIARRPTAFPNQPAQMPPLITRVDRAEGTMGAPAANAPESTQEVAPTAPRERVQEQETAPAPVETLEGQTDALQVEIDALRKQDGKAKKPLLDFLASGHRASKKRRQAGETDGESLQIDPNGPLGQELKALGVNSRAAPGLFRNGGRQNLDNLVASEWEDMYPGIIDATGTQRGADYLDEQGLIDLIAREAGGDDTWLQSRARAAELERQQFEIEAQADGTPQQDFIDGVRDPDGFAVDLNAYDLLHGSEAQAKIAEDFDAYVRERGVPLGEEGRAEILEELTKYGGDGKLLLEAELSRKIELAERPDAEEFYQPIPGFDDDAPTGPSDVPTWPSDFGEPPSNARTEGAGTARDGGSDGPVTEATPEGEQALIPGVAPITQTDRLQQAQSAPMRGGDAAMDVGLFDTGARSQRDMFDDPGQEASRPVMDQATADLRESIEPNDLKVDKTGDLADDLLSGIWKPADQSDLVPVDLIQRQIERETRTPGALRQTLNRLGAALAEVNESRTRRTISREEAERQSEEILKRALLARQIMGDTAYASRAVFPLKNGKVSFEKDILPWESDLISGVLEEFGFSKKISVKRSVSERSNASVVSKPKLLFGEEVILYIPKTGARKSEAIETILHELTHLMEAHLVREDPKVLAALYSDWIKSVKFNGDEFEFFMRSQGPFHRKIETFRSSDPYLSARVNSMNRLNIERGLIKKSDPQVDYGFSFIEWFANQGSRFLVSEPKVSSLVDRFFARLSGIWKAVTERLRNEGYVAKSVRDVFEAARISSIESDAAPSSRSVIYDFAVDVDMPDGTTRKMMATQSLELMDEVDEFSSLLDLCGSVPQQ